MSSTQDIKNITSKLSITTNPTVSAVKRITTPIKISPMRGVETLNLLLQLEHLNLQGVGWRSIIKNDISQSHFGHFIIVSPNE
jgi:hypothetical protein